MLLRLESIVALGAEAMMLDVVLGIRAVRNVVERQVRNFRQRGLKLSDRLPLLFLPCLDRRLQPGDLRDERGRARLVLLGLGLADLFGGGVAPGQRAFELGDRGAAPFIERNERAGRRGMAATGKPAVEFFRMLANPLDVVHGQAPREPLVRRPRLAQFYSAGLVWAAAGPAAAAAFFSTSRTDQIEPS